MFSTEVKSRNNEDFCLLIQPDNHSFNYICDCGEASLLSVKEVQNTAAIFISHTHIDHFINFDFILRHQLGIQRKVIICGPEGIAKQVRNKIRSFTWNLVEKDAISYEIREILSEKEYKSYLLKPRKWKLKLLKVKKSVTLFSNDKFEVHFCLLDHKIPTVAYLFKEHDSVKINLGNTDFKGGKWVANLKNAFLEKDPERLISIEGNDYEAKDLFSLLSIKKGHSVGVIMDHEASKENHTKINTLFKNCDRVFIESFYKEEDLEFANANAHSYSTASATVLRKAKVKEAIPVHFSRRYEEADIEQLKAEFEAAFSK